MDYICYFSSSENSRKITAKFPQTRRHKQTKTGSFSRFHRARHFYIIYNKKRNLTDRKFPTFLTPNYSISPNEK